MKFKPQTEQEINESRPIFELLKDGEYDFTVVYAEDKISKNDNEYIYLKLQVWDEFGRERLIHTNLGFIKLLKHFCDVTGLQDKYNLGEINAVDCLDKVGKVLIGTEKGKKKENSNDLYPDKNIVKDYVPRKFIPSGAIAKQENDFTDSDLPF